MANFMKECGGVYRNTIDSDALIQKFKEIAFILSNKK